MLVERPHPVGDPEEVHARLERIGLEGERGQHHVAAVAPADDPDPGRVHVAGAGQHPLARDHVAEVGLAVLPVVHGVEGLAVAAAAAVVDVEDHVAVVHQRLDQGEIAHLGLASGPAVDHDDGRRLRLGRRLVRPVEQAGDLETVVGAEAHHLRHHQVLATDLGVQRAGQPPRGLPDRAGPEVVGRAAVARVEGDRWTRRARARRPAPGRAASRAARPASASPRRAAGRRAWRPRSRRRAGISRPSSSRRQGRPRRRVDGRAAARSRCRATGAPRTRARCRR